MKQVLQYRKSGKTQVVDVPAPMASEGGVLVHNRWSLISPGTERMLVEAGGANLINTAMKRPDLVKRVVDKARREGLGPTIQAVRGQIDTAIPLGYSSAGIVLEAGERAGFSVGERVACAGSGKANHAEFISVTKHLTVRVPDAVSLEDASFVTLGAIALQGVRIADVRVGESCVVIGLGLVGQLTVQLLKAAGCRVFGIDMAPDKVELAKTLGAEGAAMRNDPSLFEQIGAFTLGRGADAVVITAATTSSDPVELAAKVARDRGVVASVGLTGLNVPRNAYYDKELELRLSRSYGPGRYDRTYEEWGIDYPVGYVRWTEQRNMEAFLQLVAEGKVKTAPLVTHRVRIEEGEKAYAVMSGTEPYLGILLQYGEDSQPTRRVEIASTAQPIASGKMRLGVVGAGNFAKSVLLPAFKKLGVENRGVAANSGPSAQDTATRYGFKFAASDWHEIVDDPETDAVMVATRHDLHAEVASAALRAGKAVFLEKPMALSEEALQDLLAAQAESGKVLQLGFNRRFAPTTREMKALFAGRTRPLTMSYRVNAGAVTPGSWVIDPVQGGGRLLGEVCHMVDTLVYLADSDVTRVYAQSVPGASETQDDVLVTLAFQDGSIGTIAYGSGGDRSMPKEHLEVLGGGKSATLDDFSQLTVFENGSAKAGKRGNQDKGHAAELAAFVDAVVGGKASPIDPRQAAHVTRVTFAAAESARTGLPVEIEG